MRRRSVLSALAVLATAPLAVPAPAQALSCAEPRWVREPDSEISHVLVGKIVDARDQHLRVQVAEIWEGPRLAEHVWVRLDEDEAMAHWYQWSDASGAVPDGFSSPRIWVLAADEEFEVGVCSYWTLGRAVRRALEPDHPTFPLTASQVSGATEDDEQAGGVDPARGAVPDDPDPLPALGGVAFAGLVGAGTWWWHRRRAVAHRGNETAAGP